MKININNKEIELKYTFRALMIYEKIMNESFNPKGVTETLFYMYSTILASDANTDLTFDIFMEWLDDNPDEIGRFSNWLLKIADRNKAINGNDSEKQSKEERKDIKKNG